MKMRLSLLALFVLAVFFAFASANAATLDVIAETVEEEAFSGDTSFSLLKLSGDVAEIGARAFADCTSLSDVQCASMNANISSTAFEGDNIRSVTCYLGSTIDRWAQNNNISCTYYDAFGIQEPDEELLCVDLPITWEMTDVMPGQSVESVFRYAVYKGDMLVYQSGDTTETSVTYKPITEGEYYLNATISNELTTTTLSSKKVKVGSTLKMGTYEQDGKSSTKDPIEWMVLAVKGDKALVLSKKVLHVGSYFNPYWIKYKYTYWSKSYIGDFSTNYRGSAPESDATRITGITKSKIPMADGSYGSDDDLFKLHARYWCNTTFYKSAFTEKERKKIVQTTNSNPKNSTYGTKGGPDTKDYVFFLSYDEIRTYLPAKSDRKASLTYTAKKERNSSADAYYWLRSPGKYRVNAMYVNAETGGISTYGSDVGHGGGGYRPAMWIKIK